MGKRVVDFLLVLIELLLDVAVEGLRKKIDWKSEFFKEVGQYPPIFQ